jgi:hypothetical protein
MGEAETAMERLCRLVESLLQSNAHLQARLVSVEASQVTGPPFTPVQQSPDDRISTVSFVPDHSMLNDTLKRSRVYKRTWNRDSTFTTTSSKREPLALSAFSDLSLGNVSVVSVFCLPIWSSDLSNSEHYSFGSDQAGLTNLFLNEPAYQDLPEIPEMLEPEPAPTL